MFIGFIGYCRSAGEARIPGWPEDRIRWAELFYHKWSTGSNIKRWSLNMSHINCQSGTMEASVHGHESCQSFCSWNFSWAHEKLRRPPCPTEIAGSWVNLRWSAATVARSFRALRAMQYQGIESLGEFIRKWWDGIDPIPIGIPIGNVMLILDFHIFHGVWNPGLQLPGIVVLETRLVADWVEI
jgi:hypothetical protein